MGDRRNEPVRAGMRLLPVVALGLGLGLTALPQAAAAQGFGFWGGWGNGGGWDNGGNGGNGDGLQPRQVRRSIADQGFRVISPMRRNGSVFVADVLDRRGRRERLIVAAADAQILQRFYLEESPAPGAAPPREAERQPSFASRFFGDTDGGLTPPAAIPSLGRRPGVPNENDVPTRRYGDLDEGGETTVVPALPVRPQPPIRTVKPRSRLVDRTPDSAGPVRLPGAVEASPLTPAPQSPAAPRPKVVEPARAPSGPSPSPKVASRPDVPMTAPAASARRPADPLALPGTPKDTEASAPPIRSVSGGITGAPAAAASAPAAAPPTPVGSPTPVAPAKTGDVPVAPLD